VLLVEYRLIFDQLIHLEFLVPTYTYDHSLTAHAYYFFPQRPAGLNYHFCHLLRLHDRSHRYQFTFANILLA
jgi:hypothetical protein